MRQLTVGVSDSPHVTHPFTSDCEILYLDILCLLNCFLSTLLDRTSSMHSPGGIAISIPNPSEGNTYPVAIDSQFLNAPPGTGR